MAARKTHGAVFRWGTTPVTVVDVTNINPGAPTTEDIDVTSHDSGGVRQFIQGLTDYGEGSLDLNFDPDLTGHVAIWNASKTGVATPMEIQLPPKGSQTTGAKFTWTGYFKPFAMPVPTSDALRATVPIRVTTEITLVPGSVILGRSGAHYFLK